MGNRRDELHHQTTGLIDVYKLFYLPQGRHVFVFKVCKELNEIDHFLGYKLNFIDI